MLWMYNKDGGELFDSIEDAPAGYVDCPTKVKETKVVEAPKDDRLAELKAEADEKGIKYHHKAGVAKLEELLGE